MFHFYVRRTTGRLGMSVYVQDSSETFVVAAIDESGLVDSYNKRRADEPRLEQLRIGDVLSCVNGRKDVQGIRAELKESQLIHMKIQRFEASADPVPEKSAPCPQQLQSETPQAVDFQSQVLRGGRFAVTAEYNGLENEGGYIAAQRGDRIHVTANTLEPGTEDSRFPAYVYASNSGAEGWFPAALLDGAEDDEAER
mmetsp:Transcript_14158/g.38905  ORF Transcript_14158/g.38905 Transcript_14158/m.38905 type:complete len:197 (+) Transcript_14158:124-714(+)